jgi:zinc protease
MPEGYQYSRSFYERHYRPENVVLVMAGDFDTEAAKGLVRKYYGGWKPGYQAPSIQPEPPQQGARDLTVQYPGRTLPILSINYKAPAWSPSDRTAVALEVLGQIAFGANSPLYRKLVLKERRAQTLVHSFDLQRDPYLASVQAMVSNPADVKAIDAEIRAEIQRFHQDLVDSKQLADTKSNIKYGYLMDLEAALDIAFGVMQPIVSTGRLEAIEEYFRTLEAVTPEDLREAARKYLTDSGRTTITMVQEG